MVQLRLLRGGFMYQSYISKVDNKFRFYLPANIRISVKTNQFYLTFMNNDNLILCSTENWSAKDLVSSFEHSLSNEELRNLEYFVRINSTLVSLDKEGRIQIPISFKSKVNFEDGIVISEQENYISIISKSYVDRLSESVNSMIEDKRLNLMPRL